MPARLPIASLVAVLCAAGLAASGPTFWTVATSADFLAGRSEGVFVSRDGVVTLGPRLTSRLTSTPPQIWSLAMAGDGTLWAGTGADGRVLRLANGQPEQVAFDAEEANVFALAVAGGRVYAATGPDGRVHVIEADGRVSVYFDPEEKYIWALAVDREGLLWVGAGNPAVIYRVEATGAGQAVYRPPAAHVVSLAFDAESRLLAGTESPGRLYRLGADGRPFVVLDSGLSELRAVTIGPDGALYAAAVGGGGAAPDHETTTVSLTVGEPERVEPAAEPVPTAGSQVFRIAADGTWEAVWKTADIIYDLAPSGDGGVLVATGAEGRLYRLGSNRDVSLLTGVDAKQVTRFAAAAGAARVGAFATASPGRVVSIGEAPQSPATYLSPVRDTRTVAIWGLIRWESAGAVTVSTRSGNTPRPDDSWSDWSAPYRAPEGEKVQSPAARFIQWRAVLETGASADAAAPRLSAVTLAYLPRNARPVVSGVTVHPPGVVFQRPFASEDGAIAGLDDLTAVTRRPPGEPAPTPAPPGRRLFRRGLQTLAWKAEDADADQLTYTLSYRRDGQADWRVLRAGLLDTIYVWDTTAMADGRYVVRVEAADDLSNAADRVLRGHLDSESLTIDNTPPALSISISRENARARLVVEARDAMSPIEKLEYSVAGGPWQLVYPIDGLADAPTERYEIVLPEGREAADVVIRATDLLQNVTSAPAVR